MRWLLPFTAIALLTLCATNAEGARKRTRTAKTAKTARVDSITKEDKTENDIDNEMNKMLSLVISSMPESDEAVRYKTLTNEDFKRVAEELGVEVAAIKAVVKIEAGPKLEGFWAPGVPVVNYAKSLFDKYNGKTKGRKLKDAKVPAGLTGYALKEWTSLTNARKINADAADMGTYWGMFQIGGFNYKLCGCQSVEEMVAKVCESEFSQLEMFAVFIRNSGMLESLKKKDWTTFARKYNGPSYAKRGYHTRMAKEYANFKNEKSNVQSDTTGNDKKAIEIKSGVDQKQTVVAKKKTQKRKSRKRKTSKR